MVDKKEDILHKIRILKMLDEDIHENKNIDVQEGYRKAQVKIRKKSRKLYLFNTFTRAAVILVIPLLLSTLTLLYLFVHNSGSEKLAIVSYTEVSTAPGTIIKTQLPDQSEVWLNGGSRLRYPTEFTGEKRFVLLTGEAFFNVRTNPDFPFEVEIPSGMRILAKGTSFNIHAYDDDTIHEATLQNGFVDVVQGDLKFNLLPGESVTFNQENGEIGKSKTNVEEKIGWKDGLLIFRNTLLEDVFKRLSRRYNVDFNICNKSSVNYRVRATFSTETITQILDALKLAAPIKWSLKDMEKQSDLSFTRQQIDIVIN